MSRTICYFKSGIGNYVVATPAFQALALMDPARKVDLCLPREYRKDSRYGAVREMAEHSPFFGEIVEWPEKKYETWFIPVQSETSDVGHFIQRNTVHNKTRWPGAPWKLRVIHEIKANMMMVEALGYKGPIPKPYVPTADGPVLRYDVPVFAVCNSSFGTEIWRKKRWRWFPKLVEMLRDRWECVIVGVGGRNDLVGVPLDQDFCGRTTIMETAEILRQATAFITTDTGCMHIASYLDVLTIGLFGSTLTSKNGPLGRRSVALRAAIPCAPCQYDSRFFTCRDYICMDSIRPEDVIRTLEKTMEEESDGGRCSDSRDDGSFRRGGQDLRDDPVQVGRRDERRYEQPAADSGGR